MTVAGYKDTRQNLKFTDNNNRNRRFQRIKVYFFKEVNQTKTLQYTANCLLAERPNKRIWDVTDVTGISLVNELLDDVQIC